MSDDPGPVPQWGQGTDIGGSVSVEEYLRMMGHHVVTPEEFLKGGSLPGGSIVPAHIQRVTHSYFVHYPDHEPRAGDPNYADFHHWREATKATARCVVGQHRDDYSDCFPGPKNWPIGLEVHHSHIEFAIQNGIDLAWLEKDYPGVSNMSEVGKWVESAANLEWRCVRHHRGVGGVHTVTASDYEGIKYFRDLTSAVA